VHEGLCDDGVELVQIIPKNEIAKMTKKEVAFVKT
jgi:hypothetical protein